MRGEYRKKALKVVNLIKKNDGERSRVEHVKNGSSQKRYLKEGETVYSPTCLTESLMSKLLIHDMEQRDLAIFDVPGVYLQTEMPVHTKIFLCIRDVFVNIMCGVSPDYKPYVKYDK